MMAVSWRAAGTGTTWDGLRLFRSVVECAAAIWDLSFCHIDLEHVISDVFWDVRLRNTNLGLCGGSYNWHRLRYPDLGHVTFVLSWASACLNACLILSDVDISLGIACVTSSRDVIR